MKTTQVKDRLKKVAEDIKLPDAESIEKTDKGALFLVGAVGLGLAMIWIGKKYLGSIIDDIQENNCLDDILITGTPCNYADRLYSAIDGIGTDNDEVFDVLNSIRTRGEYNRVSSAYSAITRGNNLNEDLRDDLSTSLFREVQQIINSKPS